MSDAGNGRVPALCRAILTFAGRIVPRERRADWREEWEGELWHEVHRRPASRPRLHGLRLGGRCLGAIPHAAHLRVADWSVDMLTQDLRHAVRSLAARPLFTATTVLTLALGIGANTAVFSIVESVLLRPLPYPNADRLVWAWGAFQGGNQASVSPPDFLDYRAQTTAFASVAASSSFPGRMTLTGGDRPESVSAGRVTSNLLSTLGLTPALGRGFTSAEETTAAADVAMLSFGLWQGRYGGRTDVVGETILLDGRPYAVVGVLPEALRYPRGTDVWIPLTFAASDFQVRRFHFLRPVLRLKEGVTLAQGQADADLVAKRLEAAYPESNSGWRMRLLPLREALVGSVRPALIVLLGAVGLVLLIACGNVASLALARASTRHTEMAVRAALGASRGRVVRLLVTESLVLALFGGAVGVGVALWAVGMVRRLGPTDLPRMDEIGLDARTLSFTIALTLACGVLFGLAPALEAARRDVMRALRQGTRAGGRGDGLRRTLVVGEVAVSLVLVIGATLLVRSFSNLRHSESGFDAEGVLTARVTYSDVRYPDSSTWLSFVSELRSSLAALPGVEVAGVTAALPIREGNGDTRIWAEERPPTDPAVWSGALIQAVDEDYFRAMSIPVTHGRAFLESDRHGSTPVTVVNEAFVRRFFPGEDPIGKRVVADLGEPATLEVVGVVGDVRQWDLAQESSAEYYLPLRQGGMARDLTIVLRTTADPGALVDPAQRVIRAADPDQALAVLEPMTAVIATSVARPRFQTLLLAAFAIIALALAAVGVHGILAYRVAQQRREIGIRLALGARSRDVLRMVVGDGLILTAAGVALGVAGAFALTRLMTSLLFEVRPHDPLAFVLAPLILATVAAVASWVPARRAASLDPVTTLRDE